MPQQNQAESNVFPRVSFHSKWKLVCLSKIKLKVMFPALHQPSDLSERPPPPRRLVRNAGFAHQCTHDAPRRRIAARAAGHRGGEGVARRWLNVQEQLVGWLQAMRAEPHHFLPGLPTAPAMVLRIRQAASRLPGIRRPGVRHGMFPPQPTQGNPELGMIAVRQRPVADCSRTVGLPRIERRLT